MVHSRIACALLFGLASGCGPMMAAPGAPPIPTQGDTEVAHGAVGGIVQPHAFAEAPPQVILPLAAYQFSLRSPIGPDETNEMGLIGTVGTPSGLSGGAFFRHALVGKAPESNGQMSLQLSGGLAWIGISAPVALKLSDTAWITTQPGLRTTAHPILHLPIGLSFDMGNGKRIDAELGAHFSSKEDNRSVFQDSYAAYAGISFARTLGRTSDAPSVKPTRGTIEQDSPR